MLDTKLKAAIDKAFSYLPSSWDTPSARVQVYAIGYQESNFQYRRQMNNGPAASFWQFERGGGIKGVLTHPASKEYAETICEIIGVKPNPDDVWRAMLTDDVIGAAFARLLLYTDPKQLPAVPDDVSMVPPTDPKSPLQSKSWAYYYRNWRPGKPHPDKWPKNYQLALDEFGAFQ